ncbi:hypothetical protein [Tenggerimyces flavus]|uniref:Uncharacterized protein n=1 Tax=Tenggerimyces flavus TaxID=1708749 RepID=A0ABV7YIV2_9ACTN|nr:hypothetical protein [Tenggerimyces flavus]MBM7789847.1 hypothetical protein [Tenggerimyces flavus]
MSTDSMEIYLNDHLAGATAAIQLIERMQSDEADERLAKQLAQLRNEIEDDRDTLLAIVDRVEARQHRVKHAAAAVLEQLGQLKLSKAATGSTELTRLLELETLYLGVHGKRALWRALRAVAVRGPTLATFDFDELIDRANHQLEALDGLRIEAATAALVV